MKYKKVPEATIRRLSRYSRYLEEMDEKGEKVVSSAQLAKNCGVNAPQVRKDLDYFGEFGIRGRGYYVEYLLNNINRNKKTSVSGLHYSLIACVIHKKVGLLLIKQINPGGEHGRDCSHVADQDRKGKGSDPKSHDRGISLEQTYYSFC